MTVGTREAKRSPTSRRAYLRQKGDSANADVTRRATESRPFIAWDGEGWSDDSGRHHYMLFGASTGDEVSGQSLGTVDCFELLLRVEQAHPNSYHVIFAGNYDVNMMLRDVDLTSLERLKTLGKTYWRDYYIEYRKSKWFRIRKNDVSITVFDVFTFFQCSFVKALETYIGETDEDVIRIKDGKGKRSAFTYADLAEVRDYFRAELRYLVRLTDRLREYLHRAGIHIGQWHGPGAVASSVLKARGISRSATPTEVGEASQFAYSGGRFEQFRIGHHPKTVYQYDIRSAYPAAIATLPSLDGQWRHTTKPGTIHDFGLYHVVYDARDATLLPTTPHPFFWRARNGCVFYPPYTEGWYWGVEVRAALSNPGIRNLVTVTEGWVYQAHDSSRPFAWINEYYERRALWKRQGEPAQLALKLAMNSVYGKLAQQVGWRILADGTVKLPTFHQLEYAGFITASTRATIYRAMVQAGDSLIAVETDGIFTTRPLRLDEGPNLGQWEHTRYDAIMYLQSGVYWCREGEEWKTRSRGFGRNDITAASVMSYLASIRDCQTAYHTEPLSAMVTRFKTLGIAIGKPEWRTWVTERRELRPGLPGGKREHTPWCYECPGYLSKGLHPMEVPRALPGVDFTQPSTKYPLEWLGQPRLEAHDEILTVEDGVEEWEVDGL